MCHFQNQSKIGMYMNQDKYFRENMTLRANKKKVVGGKMTTLRDENKLIFERQLGHKADIPGAAQWR